MLQRRRSTNKKILVVFGVLVAILVLLVGCMVALGSVVASEGPKARPHATTQPAATTTATPAPPPTEPARLEPDTVAQVQANIDATGGWDECRGLLRCRFALTAEQDNVRSRLQKLRRGPKSQFQASLWRT